MDTARQHVDRHLRLLFRSRSLVQDVHRKSLRRGRPSASARQTIKFISRRRSRSDGEKQFPSEPSAAASPSRQKHLQVTMKKFAVLYMPDDIFRYSYKEAVAEA